MGMFDTVVAECPKCAAQIEFQSKAGPCVLQRYSAHNVPPEVAQDIDGDTEWCKCGEKVTIRLSQQIQRVRMFTTLHNHDDFD